MDEVTAGVLVQVQGKLKGLARLMAIAEEEIAALQAAHPDRSDELFDAFLFLYSRYPFERYLDDLYRAHCRELLARIIAGEDTRPATNAELLVVMFEHSWQSTGPNRLSGGLAILLLTRTLPQLTERLQALPNVQAGLAEQGGWIEPVEQWPGELDELLDRLRHGLRNPDRRWNRQAVRERYAQRDLPPEPVQHALFDLGVA